MLGINYRVIRDAKVAIVISLGCAVLPATVSAQGPERSAAPVALASATRSSDRVIARNVRKAISNSRGVNMTALTVRVKNGVVTLAGSVPANDEVIRAADAAKSVSGVVAVRNKLTVQPMVN